MPPYIPPDSGDLPEGGKRILRAVYVSLRKKNTSQESAAKQAWAAVKNAGYSKDSSGHWSKSKECDAYMKTLEQEVGKVRKAQPQLDDDDSWAEAITHPMTATTGPPLPPDAGSPMNRHWPPSELGGQLGSNLKLSERFHWMAPFKIIKDGARRLLQGEAITVGKSQNKVPYTEEELLRGTRTLAGKPLLHNHIESVDEAKAYLNGLHADGTKFAPSSIPPLVRANIEAMINRGDVRVGQVVDAEYEDGASEYVAAVDTPEAIAMVDAGLVKGPSIGAIPRNRDLKHPQGIMFEDMSLITDPETPGDPDATAKVMEKLREMLAPPMKVSIHQNIHQEMHNRILNEMDGRLRPLISSHGVDS